MFTSVVSNISGRIRREKLNDREHLVAPLTLIVPGVLSGSKGPLFYPPSELAKDPTAWDHIPMTIGHPKVNGQDVSARDPAILNQYGVGYVFHAKHNGKLTAEGWFDVEKTRRLDSRILSALERGEPIELSTGLFTDDEPTAGTYNGREYKFIARNYRPDHLAILPDTRGACSIADGCGVLNTNPEGNDMDDDDYLPLPPRLIEEEEKAECECQAARAAHNEDDYLPVPGFL